MVVIEPRCDITVPSCACITAGNTLQKKKKKKKKKQLLHIFLLYIFPICKDRISQYSRIQPDYDAMIQHLRRQYIVTGLKIKCLTSVNEIEAFRNFRLHTEAVKHHKKCSKERTY